MPTPEDLPDPGIEPVSLTSPALTGRLFTTGATWISQLSMLLKCGGPLHHPTVFIWPHCTACGILVPQPCTLQRERSVLPREVLHSPDLLKACLASECPGESDLRRE